MIDQQDLQTFEEIRWHQLTLLEHTFLKLLTVIQDTTQKIYLKDTEADYTEKGYRQYFWRIVGDFTAMDVEKPIIADKREETAETPEARQEMLDLYTKVLGYLYRIDYIPPKDPWLILLHLHTMWRDLNHDLPINYLAMTPLTKEVLSLSFAKLLSKASERIAERIAKDSRELPRSAKSAESKRIKAQWKKENVVRLYRYLKKNNAFKKMNPNAVAKTILKNWKDFPPDDPNFKEPPALTTIKDYLNEDPQIRKELMA
jgi:hypothetical protein